MPSPQDNHSPRNVRQTPSPRTTFDFNFQPAFGSAPQSVERPQPVSVFSGISPRSPANIDGTNSPEQKCTDGTPLAKTPAAGHLFAKFLTPSPAASSSQPTSNRRQSADGVRSDEVFIGSRALGLVGSPSLPAANAQTQRTSFSSDNPFARFLGPETPFTPKSGRSSSASNNPGTLTPQGDGVSQPSFSPLFLGATGAETSMSISSNLPENTLATDDQITTSPTSPVPLRTTPQLKRPGVKSPSQLDEDFSHLRIGRPSSSPPPSPSPSPNVLPQVDGSTAATHLKPTEAAQPYDVSSEATPAHPLYLPSFQKSLQSGRELASDTADTIQRIPVGLRDQSLNELLFDAEALSAFQPSAAKTVAILGDSGEGKSSLINSLLHIPGLAYTSDAGSACTSVVTEYRYKKPQHTAPITIEAEYLSREGIEEMVTELLWSYRSLYHPDLESSEASAKEYERVQRESSEAWSALEAAFGHHRELKEHSFRDQSPGSHDRLQAQLIAWSRDIQWPSGSSNGRYTDAVQTAEECCRSTAIFMSDSFWPFTKVIRVFVDAEVLKAGVTLVDLPGLQDTNLARIKITQDYLMKCDNVFLVAKISRAITDQSLKSSLYTVFSRHMPSEWNDAGGQRRKDFSVTVICTKSEDIDIKSARERFCGPGRAIPKNVIDNMDEEIRKAKASDNYVLKKQLKQRREALFIEARNSHVTEGLQKAYASKVPEGKLNVFCVSNRLYEKQCRRGDLDLVAVSGITRLRTFCRLLGADAQLAQAHDFLKSSLFSLVNSFELWTVKMSAASSQHSISQDSKNLILQEYRNLEQTATAGTTKLIDDFDVCFRDQILKFGEHLHDKWEEAACREANKWEDWHHSQYNAWCLRNGCHSTPKRPYQDWNADIIWKMRTDLGFQWDIMEEDVPDVFGVLLETADAAVESLVGIVRESAPGDIHAMLEGGMISCLRHFHHKIGLVQAKLLSEVKLTRRYASETNHMSYILGQMMPAYRDASSECGTGRWARQKAIIGGRVGDGLLFPSICMMMQRRHQTLVDLTRNQIQDLVRGLTNKIKGDIDSALASVRQLRQGEEMKEMVAIKELLGELRATALWLGEEVAIE